MSLRLAYESIFCREILRNHPLPWATQHYENSHWILQQDGAPAHLAKSTLDCCLTNLPDASEWPAIRLT
ncbi:hypothetical protein ANCDUO_23774 [Ancylostoma duodenale]|uniref:Tc1-like transposase DDE domain-containing protein n=1 Tax=Ancylostoma duodenale TaxID=51022 RepID=A0A0C2FCA3_9BILA|nr:hypothetical protein ANCDUO_23774 [Ancylostoma duodenale]